MLVTYIDHMGTDLSVVNAAKVSFGKRSEWVWLKGDGEVLENPECWSLPQKENHCTRTLSKRDQGLIQFLARGCTSGDWESLCDKVFDTFENPSPCQYHDLKEILTYIRRMPSHWSPFAHTAISLHLKMPIFVARQIMKHTTGIEYNEVSRRYVDSDPEFYVPAVWRKKADNVKQGSSDEDASSETVVYDVPYYAYEMPLTLYKKMLQEGVAPEQARMVLPQSMYTEVIATGNLYAWANLYVQRTDSHAQKETQDLAKQIGEIIQPLYPVSWEALTA
jgi:thymidylate synthase (FAD)